MCVTICGRFCPDKGAVAGYGNRIRAKYTAKWGVQIAGMIFQTGSKKLYTMQLIIPEHLHQLQQAVSQPLPTSCISITHKKVSYYNKILLKRTAPAGESGRILPARAVLII